MRRVLLMLQKDFRLEMAGMQIVPVVVIMSILIILIFGFALNQNAGSGAQASAILTIAFLFCGLVAVEKCFDAESHHGLLEGLKQLTSKTDFIFCGKFLWVMSLLYFVEFWTCIVFSILFDYELHKHIGPLIIVVTLFNAGFSAIGVLFAAMTSCCRGKAFLLVILLLPLLIVPVIATVQSLKLIFDGAGIAGISNWLKLIAGFDFVFGALSALFFDRVIE